MADKESAKLHEVADLQLDLETLQDSEDVTSLLVRIREYCDQSQCPVAIPPNVLTRIKQNFPDLTPLNVKLEVVEILHNALAPDQLQLFSDPSFFSELLLMVTELLGEEYVQTASLRLLWSFLLALNGLDRHKADQGLQVSISSAAEEFLLNVLALSLKSDRSLPCSQLTNEMLSTLSGTESLACKLSWSTCLNAACFLFAYSDQVAPHEAAGVTVLGFKYLSESCLQSPGDVVVELFVEHCKQIGAAFKRLIASVSCPDSTAPDTSKFSQVSDCLFYLSQVSSKLGKDRKVVQTVTDLMISAIQECLGYKKAGRTIIMHILMFFGQLIMELPRNSRKDLLFQAGFLDTLLCLPCSEEAEEQTQMTLLKFYDKFAEDAILKEIELINAGHSNLAKLMQWVCSASVEAQHFTHEKIFDVVLIRGFQLLGLAEIKSVLPQLKASGKTMSKNAILELFSRESDTEVADLISTSAIDNPGLVLQLLSHSRTSAQFNASLACMNALGKNPGLAMYYTLEQTLKRHAFSFTVDLYKRVIKTIAERSWLGVYDSQFFAELFSRVPMTESEHWALLSYFFGLLHHETTLKFPEVLPLIFEALAISTYAEHPKTLTYIDRLRTLATKSLNRLIISNKVSLVQWLRLRNRGIAQHLDSVVDELISEASSFEPLGLKQLIQEATQSATTDSFSVTLLERALRVPSRPSRQESVLIDSFPSACFVFADHTSAFTVPPQEAIPGTLRCSTILFWVYPMSGQLQAIILTLLSPQNPLKVVLDKNELTLFDHKSALGKLSVHLNAWNFIGISLKMRDKSIFLVNSSKIIFKVSRKHLNCSQAELGTSFVGLLGEFRWLKVNLSAGQMQDLALGSFVCSVQDQSLLHKELLAHASPKKLRTCLRLARASPIASLQSLGGISCLLPLLESSATYEAGFRLIISLMNSVHVKSLRCEGIFAIASVALERSHNKLQENFIEPIEMLLPKLSDYPKSLGQLIDHIILNTEIWAVNFLLYTTLLKVTCSYSSGPWKIIDCLLSINPQEDFAFADLIACTVFELICSSQAPAALLSRTLESPVAASNTLVTRGIRELFKKESSLNMRDLTSSQRLDDNSDILGQLRLSVDQRQSQIVKNDEFTKLKTVKKDYAQRLYLRHKKFLARQYQRSGTVKLKLRGSVDLKGRRMILSVYTPGEFASRGSIMLSNLSNHVPSSFNGVIIESILEPSNPTTIEEDDILRTPSKTELRGTLCKFDCERIMQKGTYFGDLEIYGEWLLFSSSSLPKSEDEHIGSAPSFTRIEKMHRWVWHVSEIKEVVSYRFIHRRTAFELYLYSGKVLLFNLFSRDQLRQAFLRMKNWPVTLVSASKGQAQRNLQHEWRTGQLTNFEYLMKLNKLASRSFNDLSQYPVFPWVLCNYSGTFTLTDTQKFRDLSHPVAAQTQAKRDELTAKYSRPSDFELEDFHHGSHYSNAGVVSFYLVRLQHYLDQAKAIQGGNLDVADRLFASMRQAWNGSSGGASDCKELVPELFYLPEALYCLDKNSLGTTQKNREVRDVICPEWAVDNFDFVFKHRLALDSPIVTSKLSEWIDLVFGYKQKGPAGIRAQNIFFCTTYQDFFEKAWKQAQESQSFNSIQEIAEQAYHFGQTPPQLFTKKHDSFRHDYIPGLVDHFYSSNSGFFAFERILFNGEVAFLNTIEGKHFVIAGAKNGWPHLLKGVTFSPSQFQLDADFVPVVLETGDYDPPMHIGPHSMCLYLDSYLITSNYPDCSFKAHSLDGTLCKQIWFHTAPVTCVSANGDILVTGSADSTMASWTYSLSEPDVIFGGHDAGLVELAVLASYCVVASLDQSGTLLIHELRTGETLHRLELAPLCRVVASEMGYFVCYGGCTVAVYTLNGVFVRKQTFNTDVNLVKSSLNGALLFISTTSALIISDVVLSGKSYPIIEPYTARSFRVLGEQRVGKYPVVFVSSFDQRGLVYCCAFEDKDSFKLRVHYYTHF